MTFRIFIGWDSRFPEPGLVLAHTLRAHSSIPLDIRFLDLRHLRDCYGYNRPVDPTASTEFSFSRFLVPWLCDYKGHALFMDNDCICRGDVAELYELTQFSWSLRVVKHDYTPSSATKFGLSNTPQATYPRKNWSSVMLMDCRDLKCWKKEVVETAPGSRLHRFEDVPDHLIGNLPDEWNTLTKLQPNTKLLHYTEGGPYLAGCEDCPDAELWRSCRMEWLLYSGKDPNTPLVPIKL